MNTERPVRVIYPQPKQIIWHKGFLSIESQVVLHLSDKSDCVDFFRETWENYTCRKPAIKIDISRSQAVNSFSLEVTGIPELPKLEDKSTYALVVNKQGAAVVGIDDASFRQAWLTMLEMLTPNPGSRKIEGFQLPCSEIQDYPLLKFRSAHLCVFPETTLSALEKSIKLLGRYKYSHVVIEFWGMLKLDTLPELSWPQAYSKDAIRPLLQLIRDFGMQPIPMFNHWGHASSSRACIGRHVVLDQNPLLAPLFEPDGWTWCLTNPESLRILADVRKELIDFFGDIDYFHLGCDEAYSHATCDSCRQHDPAKLFAGYLNSINDDLKNYKVRPIIWGDALLDNSKWDGYTALSRPDQRTHESIDVLSKDFIIADWQYGITDPGKNATVKYFMDKGFDVVTAPWDTALNVQALDEIAVNEKAFGMMSTTWHILPETISLLPWGGSIMWAGESAWHQPQYTSSYMLTSQAAFLRKIRKGPVDFDNAGWRSFEV